MCWVPKRLPIEPLLSKEEIELLLEPGGWVSGTKAPGWEAGAPPPRLSCAPSRCSALGELLPLCDSVTLWGSHKRSTLGLCPVLVAHRSPDLRSLLRAKSNGGVFPSDVCVSRRRGSVGPSKSAFAAAVGTERKEPELAAMKKLARLLRGTPQTLQGAQCGTPIGMVVPPVSSQLLPRGRQLRRAPVWGQKAPDREPVKWPMKSVEPRPSAERRAPGAQPLAEGDVFPHWLRRVPCRPQLWPLSVTAGLRKHLGQAPALCGLAPQALSSPPL